MESEQFLEELSTFAQSEGGVQKLRDLILQLAVQGKLVPQDPNDEPAAVLLERIATEKARLVAEKKIRKPKALPPIEEAEVPFDVPKGWVWTRLNDTVAIGTGTTPAKSNIEYYSDGTVPWVSSGLTGKRIIDTGTAMVTQRAVDECRLRYPPGSLVVALYGQGKTRGQVAWLGIHATVNQACAVVEPVVDTEPLHRYLLLVLQRNYDALRQLAAGGAQPNLNVGKLTQTLVPLPPLAEQHRIVAKVELLMALCDQLEQSQTPAMKLQESYSLAEAMVN